MMMRADAEDGPLRIAAVVGYVASFIVEARVPALILHRPFTSSRTR